MNREKGQYLKELLEHCGCQVEIEKSAADATDLLRFIPGIGGAAHGIANPAQGASRGETMTYEGMGGALGGLLGLLGGAAAGHGYTSSNNIEDPSGKLMGLAALLGSGIGTAAGSVPGRFLAKRDVPEQKDMEELRQIVEELQKRKDAGGVNINVSSGMPLEADEETGSE